ncbi:MAG: MFS transporter [Acidobacteriota bacterium]|nr:MFS transporter [Acidobacteriota bacterium]
MKPSPFLRTWGRFAVLWGPQTLAITGRGLTTFALGVWVYERTHSVTLFALLEVSGILPGIVAAPLIGWAVDRLGPRPAMVLADSAALAAVLALELAFVYGIASPLLVYAIITAGAFLTCLRWPAYTALVTLVAPPDQLPRAAALMQVAYAGQQVVAPVVAGVLIGVIGPGGVIAIDMAASIVALASLALVNVRTETIRGAEVWEDVRRAWRLIGDRGLFRLAGYIIASYLPGGMVIALATPLVLTIAGPAALGLVLAAMGVGMLLGSVAASALARPEGGITRLLRYDAMLVAAMLGAGFATTPVRVALIGAVFLFGLAGVIAEEQAVWQVRIPADVQGRVFALRRAITWISLPVSYVIAGPLADHVFVPAMSTGGALVSWLGPIMGTGPGRGIALLLMCGGLAKGLVVFSGARDRKLRRLDLAA